MWKILFPPPIVLLIFSLFFNVTQQTYADEISIVADPWCPYTCADVKNRPGALIEIAQKIFEPLGHKVTYHLRPWSRAIIETELGKFDAIAGVPLNSPKGFYYPENMQALATSCIFTKSGITWRYHNPNDLKQVNLGVIADYQYDVAIRHYLLDNPKSKNISRIFGENDTLFRLFTIMKIGRIDALIEERHVFDEMIRKNGFDPALYNKNYCFQTGPIYIAFSPHKKASEKFQKLLSVGMRSLKNSGELASIMKKYSLDNPP